MSKLGWTGEEGTEDVGVICSVNWPRSLRIGGGVWSGGGNPEDQADALADLRLVVDGPASGFGFLAGTSPSKPEIVVAFQGAGGVFVDSGHLTDGLSYLPTFIIAGPCPVRLPVSASSPGVGGEISNINQSCWAIRNSRTR